MRRLEWPIEDAEQLVGRAWVLGWEALNAYGAGDTAATRRLFATQQAYEKLGIKEPVPGATDGSTQFRYQKAGGTMLLEEEHFHLLKAAIEALRQRKDRAGNPVLTGAHAEPLLWLDDFLKDPPAITPEDPAKS